MLELPEGYAVARPVIEIVDAEGVETPRYMTEGAAGFDIAVYRCDLCSYPYKLESIESDNQVIAILPHGHHAVFPVFKVKIPDGYALDIRERSGWFKKGLLSKGLIDSDYTGEIVVIAYNIGHNDLIIRAGDRIAQAVLISAPQAAFNRVSELQPTERGDKGFGHTGFGTFGNPEIGTLGNFGLGK